MRSHKKHIELALKLAEKGKGCTSPNPLVGAIIVKRNKEKLGLKNLKLKKRKQIL